MGEESGADRVWRLMKKIGFCMLSTRDGDEIRSRPMAAHVARDEHAIYFLTDAASHKDDKVERDANVNLAFGDTGGQKYVSVTGRAAVSNDRAKIEELWSTPARAWWDSPKDPALRLLKVTPNGAQYWDSPGTAVSYVKMIAAAMTNTRPAVGENAKVTL
jgi:general stress protein 26